MPRKSRYTITAADLATICTECGYAIPPNEVMRLDFNYVRCPKCLKDFIPVPKGNTSSLGN